MRKSWRRLFAAACAGVLLIAVSPRPSADSTALWTIVHTQCGPSLETTGKPIPCAFVSPVGDPAGYALLKDRNGVAQFLLIPTARVTGIESPDLLKPDAPNYFEDAWKARALVGEQLHADLPRGAISLAINSAAGRSQNQLHIHIDCIRQDVAAVLKQHESEIGPAWSQLSLPPYGHVYKVRRLEEEELDRDNPIKLVADEGPDVRDDMAVQSVAVIGASFSDGRSGFYLLNDRVNVLAHDAASAEELQDHDCAITKTSP